MFSVEAAPILDELVTTVLGVSFLGVSILEGVLHAVSFFPFLVFFFFFPSIVSGVIGWRFHGFDAGLRHFFLAMVFFLPYT